MISFPIGSWGLRLWMHMLPDDREYASRHICVYVHVCIHTFRVDRQHTISDLRIGGQVAKTL